LRSTLSPRVLRLQFPTSTEEVVPHSTEHASVGGGFFSCLLTLAQTIPVSPLAPVGVAVDGALSKQWCVRRAGKIVREINNRGLGEKQIKRYQLGSLHDTLQALLHDTLQALLHDILRFLIQFQFEIIRLREEGQRVIKCHFVDQLSRMSPPLHLHPGFGDRQWVTAPPVSR